MSRPDPFGANLTACDRHYAELRQLQGPIAVLTDHEGCFLSRATQATRHTVMVSLGHHVRIIGEQTPVITAHIDQLLPDLYRRGMRILDLLERVGEPAEATVTLADLKESPADVRSHLVARGLDVQ